MDVREKLVEILLQEDDLCERGECKDCFANGSCYYYCVADRLIANGITVQEWVSVKERLPQEKVNCIVHYKHAYCDNDDYWAIGMCFYDGEKFRVDPAYKVTHWMPIHQPPKGWNMQ